MIIFDLICDHQHRFEGWFHNSPDFAEQQANGLVFCPQCASPNVRKLPSAVAISKHGLNDETKIPPSAAITTSSLPTAGTQAMAMYRQLAQAMIAITDDVGTSFAEEARRMHYEEIPERPIRGQATNDECDALQDEGIPVLRLPNIKEEDLN